MIAIILMIACQSSAQFTRMGGKVGLNIHFGTHFQRLGITAGAFYIHEFIQVNGMTGLDYYLKTPGPGGRGLEGILSLGTTFLWGKDSVVYNPFMHQVSNQSYKPYSVGYAMNVYGDMKKTSQRTGVLGFQWKEFEFIHENDVLGNLKTDKYRTSAFLLAYRYEDMRFGMSSVLWTGNTGSLRAKNVHDKSFARFGYIDMTDAEFGNISHGILGVQAEYAFYGHQVARASIGIDAEQVRNVLQNKLAHDSWFLPEKWNKQRNYHVPMIDTKGDIYLYKEGQQVRPPRLYIDLSMNPYQFY